MLAPVTTAAAITGTGLVASIVAVAMVGYLAGSVRIADRVARRHGVDDLRRVGDGNPGYWNARLTIGPTAARPIFVGDAAKGAVAAAVGVVAALAGAPWWTVALGGGAAMVGHAFPVTARFRGGRSVATFVGASIVAAPLAAGAAVAVCGLTRLATRRTEVAARTGVAAFPVLQLVIDGPVRTAATGALMCFVGLRFATAPRPPDHATSANGGRDR